jgi:hypothetical protein
MPTLNELNNDNSTILDSGYDDGMTSPGFHHHGERIAVEPRDIPDFGFMDLTRRADNRGFANLALEKELCRQFAEVPVEPVAETAPTVIESATGYDDGMTWPGFHHHSRRTPMEPRDIAGFGFMELCLNADNRGFVNMALVRKGIWKSESVEQESSAWKTDATPSQESPAAA